MPGSLKRESKHMEPVDLFSRLDRTFDQWVKAFPFPRPFSLAGMDWMPEDMIRVDEYRGAGEIRVPAPETAPTTKIPITKS